MRLSVRCSGSVRAEPDRQSDGVEEENDMFRPMRRFKQQLTDAECETVLRLSPRGVLSVYGEDGYPYGMPVDFVYRDGKLYFHGAKAGHKIEALRKDSRASFCVMDGGTQKNGDWPLYVRSVILFGTVRIVEDQAESLEVARIVGEKYHTPDYLEHELEKQKRNVQGFVFTVDHMTGKLVREE